MNADLRGLDALNRAIENVGVLRGANVVREIQAEARAALAALSVAQGQGFEHIGWEGRTVWPGVEPAGWWGMANRPDETPLAHPHTQYRRIYAGPAEGAV
jgi:hypothetical protein